jgi:uroporphyrinogen III methyltransferase / synthase
LFFLEEKLGFHSSHKIKQGTGKVYLIGAGPGATDLLTLRGYRALQMAEVVIFDALLPQTLPRDLGLTIPDDHIFWLGTGSPRKSQEQIDELMLKWAYDGKTVARLKTGDPLVFGRGCEEMDYLLQHGVAFEVIPGLSAFTSTLTCAGFAITRRTDGRSFAVVSARCAGGAFNDDYPNADSLVIFMGVKVIGKIVAQLLKNGWSPQTPATMLERGTMPWERHAMGTLESIERVAADAGVAPPALLLVGPAADHWETSLGHPRILYTGPDPSTVRVYGEVLHWPAQLILPNSSGLNALPGIIKQLKANSFNWIIFTSANHVQSFCSELLSQQHDLRLLAGCKIAALDSQAALRLKQKGLIADKIITVDESQNATKMLGESTPGKALIVGKRHLSNILATQLESEGWTLTQLALLKKDSHPDIGRPLPQYDVIYFDHPSAVHCYWKIYGKQAFQKEIWCRNQESLSEVEKLGFESSLMDPSENR